MDTLRAQNVGTWSGFIRSSTRTRKSSQSNSCATPGPWSSAASPLFGSGQLCATLLEAGLFDEVRLGGCPSSLAAASPWSDATFPRLRLKLLQARPLNSGTVILRYEPGRKVNPEPVRCGRFDGRARKLRLAVLAAPFIYFSSPFSAPTGRTGLACSFSYMSMQPRA
jgi:hypothetical protein